MCYSDAEKQAVSHTRRTPEAFSRISRLYLILTNPKGGSSMDTPALRVQTLGGFSIRRGEAALTGGRSRKLFLLLAFLIWERARPVSYGELTDLLWAGREGGSLNALKAVLHRARSALDQLGPGCGKALILSREGGCQWNPEVPLVLDTEDFARLLAAGDLESRLEALALYRGDFLPSLAGHPWADARSEALRRQYLETLLAVLPALAEADRRQEIAALSVTACALEPPGWGSCPPRPCGTCTGRPWGSGTPGPSPPPRCWRPCWSPPGPAPCCAASTPSAPSATAPPGWRAAAAGRSTSPCSPPPGTIPWPAAVWTVPWTTWRRFSGRACGGGTPPPAAARASLSCCCPRRTTMPAGLSAPAWCAPSPAAIPTPPSASPASCSPCRPISAAPENAGDRSGTQNTKSSTAPASSHLP